MGQAEQARVAEGQSETKSAAAPIATPAEPKKLCESCGPEKPADVVFTCTNCNMPFCYYHLIPTAHHCQGAFGKPMIRMWYGEGQ